jgi:hypothetical protein
MRPTWPIRIADRLLSQDPARRNAQHALVQLAHRRADREDAERFLEAHLARRGRPAVATPDLRRRPR